MLPNAKTKKRNQKTLRTQTLDVWRGQHQRAERHTGEVKTAMMITAILLVNKKKLCANSIDGLNS